ncbi:hypothetical protein NMY22_g16923 [Coprinellus aureogranulatus]|nr:hypothetical protein NMY22_g16923 [Coprinellus aureogranulatus]
MVWFKVPDTHYIPEALDLNLETYQLIRQDADSKVQKNWLLAVRYSYEIPNKPDDFTIYAHYAEGGKQIISSYVPEDEPLEYTDDEAVAFPPPPPAQPRHSSPIEQESAAVVDPCSSDSGTSYGATHKDIEGDSSTEESDGGCATVGRQHKEKGKQAGRKGNRKEAERRMEVDRDEELDRPAGRTSKPSKGKGVPNDRMRVDRIGDDGDSDDWEDVDEGEESRARKPTIPPKYVGHCKTAVRHIRYVEDETGAPLHAIMKCGQYSKNIVLKPTRNSDDNAWIIHQKIFSMDNKGKVRKNEWPGKCREAYDKHKACCKIPNSDELDEEKWGELVDSWRDRIAQTAVEASTKKITKSQESQDMVRFTKTTTKQLNTLINTIRSIAPVNVVACIYTNHPAACQKSTIIASDPNVKYVLDMQEYSARELIDWVNLVTEAFKCGLLNPSSFDLAPMVPALPPAAAALRPSATSVQSTQGHQESNNTSKAREPAATTTGNEIAGKEGMDAIKDVRVALQHYTKTKQLPPSIARIKESRGQKRALARLIIEGLIATAMGVPSVERPRWKEKILDLAYLNKFTVIWPSALVPWPGSEDWDPNGVERWSEDHCALGEGDPAFGLIPLVKSPSKRTPTIMAQVKDCEAWFKKRKTALATTLAGRHPVPLERARKSKEISDEIDIVRKSGPSNRPEIRNKKAVNTFFRAVSMPEKIVPISSGGGEEEEPAHEVDEEVEEGDARSSPAQLPERPVKRRRYI